jgi:hypothetical protein
VHLIVLGFIRGWLNKQIKSKVLAHLLPPNNIVVIAIVF